MSLAHTIRELLPRNKVAVYVGMDDVNFMRATGRLQRAGIPYYTRIVESMSTLSAAGKGTRVSEYEIHVRRQDEYAARKAIGVF